MGQQQAVTLADVAAEQEARAQLRNQLNDEANAVDVEAQQLFKRIAALVGSSKLKRDATAKKIQLDAMRARLRLMVQARDRLRGMAREIAL